MGGLPEDRVLLVQGMASSVLFAPNEPTSPVNRRISIIVMNRDAEDRLLRVKPPEDVEEATESLKEVVATPSITTPITR